MLAYFYHFIGCQIDVSIPFMFAKENYGLVIHFMVILMHWYEQKRFMGGHVTQLLMEKKKYLHSSACTAAVQLEIRAQDAQFLWYERELLKLRRKAV